ncbi:Elongation factor Tu GTP binding domain protein [Caballeronia choica]|uniref:Elongation factor Tu GTP binding domain protein n=1 Tax=Caballeronia choica TaxID=326476 RepID=A0A158KPH1_9BURK|nr:hypothetical protein [Caballeronia choica]SAL82490.1 Elongation factor Tu GTP binding domain protein [Caballeronia choica]
MPLVIGKFWRSVILVTVVIVGAIGLVWAAFIGVPEVYAAHNTQPMSDASKLFSGTLLSAAGFLFVMLFDPLKVRLGEAVKDVVGIVALPACRVFIYGHNQTGKTTLIRRLVALRQDGNEPSTKIFSVYEMIAPLNLESNRTIRMLIADYRGESNEEVLVDPPAFFAYPGHRHINVLIFMVDMLKEKPVRPDGMDLNDYTNKVLSAIENRIEDEMERYITPYEIKKAFKVCGFSDKLCAVRFVINKIDTLRELQSVLQINDIDAFAHDKFDRLINEVRNQCEKLKIQDKFAVKLISARTREGVDELITEVMDLYQRYRRIEDNHARQRS